MNEEAVRTQNLEELFDNCPTMGISESSRYVIFSDLHMGGGSRNDDFRRNSRLFTTVLKEYYGGRKFHLILNGDVEDLQRFRLRSIVHRWSEVYEVFALMAEHGGLTRIVGNHDLELLEGGPGVGPLALLGSDQWPETFTSRVQEALRLIHAEGELFIFHGHQTSYWYRKHNNKARLLLRYVANPLHIGSPTVAADSRKRFKVERRAYEFASRKKILAVIAHTHRPLFESMSKADSLLFEIETLCRAYPASDDRPALEERVHRLKAELDEISAEEAKNRSHASLYRENLLVPSLFNSGSVLDKRGITCLEIEQCCLRLVYWYDATQRRRGDNLRDKPSEQLPGTPYRRHVMREDSLSYIFGRVRLLA
jgi:hypothetical protein